jgi:hypothetical protein
MSALDISKIKPIPFLVGIVAVVFVGFAATLLNVPLEIGLLSVIAAALIGLLMRIADTLDDILSALKNKK